MLLRFAFANHRSFAERAEISFVAARGTELSHHPRPCPGLRHGALPVVGLYGANASGKSSALRALTMMGDHVTRSFIGVKPRDKVPCQPFKLDSAKAAKPSRFECDILLGGLRYHYGFTCVGSGFEEEWLHVWTRKEDDAAEASGVHRSARQIWFHRKRGEPTYFGPKLRRPGGIPDITERPNSLLLSAAAQVRHAQLSPVYDFFAERVGYADPNAHFPFWYSQSPLVDSSRRSQLLALFGAADLGIVDLRIVSRRERAAEAAKAFRETGVTTVADDLDRRLQDEDPQQIQLAHQSGGAPIWLEPEEESDGTVALLNHLHCLLPILDSGGLLVVDELDRSLHPQLCARTVGLFADPATNPKNAQLLFASHDTTLFRELRRDEIVLAEKAQDGSSSLAPLSDFKALKREDLETYYRDGRYGGVPRLGDFAHALRTPRRAPVPG